MKLFEKHIQDAIHIRFSLPMSLPKKLSKKIKQADHIAAFYEATTFSGFSKEEALRYFGYPHDILPSELNLQLCSTQQIENAFLTRFNNIELQRSQ
ncbi:hypothetical protein H710_00584 [Bartonella bacilliformis Ver097]|uniref:Uncharacterized protein n=1 Tax=Bartonella bacilliformis Ver097 TaxID=1293911 RepID=A0A072R211_BARBA|nr:hypothetical protein H710_00584 [Bartonella bacilliformis Ver097]